MTTNPDSTPADGEPSSEPSPPDHASLPEQASEESTVRSRSNDREPIDSSQFSLHSSPSFEPAGLFSTRPEGSGPGAVEPEVSLPERFELRGVLGEGSYGVVYAAFDRELKRDVAIKTGRRQLFGATLDLFVREAQTTCRLKHQNIVTIYDIIKNENGIYIVSDLIHGKTLHHWLHNQELSPERAVQLLIVLARALHYAHEQKVIHRDIKPGNIVMDAQGQPHILDFGLSQSLDNSQATISHTGQPIGTPAFMAPEQVAGDRDQIDHRTDIYALGVTLYQSLTQRLPFSGDRMEVYHAIVHEDPPPPRRWVPTLPKSLEAICLKAMAKNRDDRYQSAVELAEDLQRFLDGRKVQAYGRWDRRVVVGTLKRRWLPSTLIIAMATLAVVAWWLYQERLLQHPQVLVVLNCSQNEADVIWTPYDLKTGLVQSNRAVLGRVGRRLYLEPGFYHVQLQYKGEIMEVFRTVPTDRSQAIQQGEYFYGVQVPYPHRSSHANPGGVIELSEVRWVSASELAIPVKFYGAAQVTLVDSQRSMQFLSGKSLEVPAFVMATNEVTWRDLQKQWPKLHLPDTVELDAACQGVSWDLATTFAELHGACLPDPWQMEWAATNQGTTSLPSGLSEVEVADEEVRPDYGQIASWDRTLGEPVVRGLLTGVNEWTSLPLLPIRFDRPSQAWVPVPTPNVVSNVIVDADTLSNSPDSGSPSANLKPVDPAAFPYRWIAVARDQHTKLPTWTVTESLVSITRSNPLNNLGFRIVRRVR